MGGKEGEEGKREVGMGGEGKMDGKREGGGRAGGRGRKPPVKAKKKKMTYANKNN
jgi:hypothetical protein